METQPQAGDLRGLKALVGGLGALVVLGTALVIGVVIHRLYAKPPAPSMTAAQDSAPIPGAAAALPGIAARLAPGETIKSITAAGEDVAIWVNGPGGDKILLLNPVTGKLTLAVSTAP